MLCGRGTRLAGGLTKTIKQTQVLNRHIMFTPQRLHGGVASRLFCDANRLCDHAHSLAGAVAMCARVMRKSAGASCRRHHDTEVNTLRLLNAIVGGICIRCRYGVATLGAPRADDMA